MRKSECTSHWTWRSNSKTWLLLMKSWMSKAKTWMLHKSKLNVACKNLNRECKLKWKTQNVVQIMQSIMKNGTLNFGGNGTPYAWTRWPETLWPRGINKLEGHAGCWRYHSWKECEYLIFTLEGVCSPESLKSNMFFSCSKKARTFGTQSKSICPFFAD